MIFYPDYQPRSRGELEGLFASQRAARLVTLDPRGAPRLGLYPFLYWADSDPIRVEVHMVRGDEQAQDLARDHRCAIGVDEVLSYVPSHWQEGNSALHADLFYRFAAISGTARLVHETADLAAHLASLLARYQPEGGYSPVDPDDPVYAPYIARLVLVRFEATAPARAKFKLGQRASAAERDRIAAGLASEGARARRTLELLGGVGEHHGD